MRKDLYLFNHNNTNFTKAVYLSNSQLGFLLHSISNYKPLCIGRLNNRSGVTLAGDINYISKKLSSDTLKDNVILVNTRWNTTFSYCSFAALLSNHWLPQEANMQIVPSDLIKGSYKLYENNTLIFYTKY